MKAQELFERLQRIHEMDRKALEVVFDPETGDPVSFVDDTHCDTDNWLFIIKAP